MLLGDFNDVRTLVREQSASPLFRETIQQAISRWATLNGCNIDTEIDALACPTPFVVAAAGGASRAAFHVAGVLGQLLDNTTQDFYPLLTFGYSIASSADGTRIVVNFENAAHVWDVPTRREVTVLRQGRNAVISPDGTLALDLAGGDAQVRNIETGNEIITLRVQNDRINFGAFSPDGKHIATTSVEGNAHIWNILTTSVELKVLHLKETDLLSASFSPDGRTIVTAGKSARIWDVTNDSEVRVLSGSRDIISAHFSPDGTKIVTADKRERIQIWDVASGLITKSFESGRYATFSRDGKRILATDQLRGIHIWDAVTGNEIRSIASLHDMAVTPDGRYMVSRDYNGPLLIWDLEQDTAGQPLTYSKNWELEPFEKQLFAISGVSGGSLGASFAYAALSDSQRTGERRPPCRRDSGDADWFAPYVKNAQQHWHPDESWRGCLQLLAAGDFLSPVMLALGSTDFLHYLDFGSRLRGDRAGILEQSWERRYANVTGHSTLEESLVVLRQRAIESGHWLPLLLLNGTSVTTGRRIITSDVDTVQRSWPIRNVAYEMTERTIQDAYDFHELLGQSKYKERVVQQTESDLPIPAQTAPVDPSDSEEPDIPVLPPAPFEPPELAPMTRDIRLSTAAGTSARFPIISPHGDIRDIKTGKIIDRVVDGGYFENFGALTATEIAHELRKRWLKPVVILINNEPTTPNLTCSPFSKLPLPKAAEKTWFALLGAPLQTVIATRQGRGTLATAALCREIDDYGHFVFVTLQPDFYNNAKDLSMSWWLSKFVQKHMDDQLESGIGSFTLDQIAGYRKLLRPVQSDDVSK